MTRYVMLVEITPRLPPGVPALTLNGTFAEGEVGTAYSYGFSASGGVAPYAYSATGLPSWASINGSTGVISGTPDAHATTSVTVNATDSVGSIVSATDGIVIYDELTITGLLDTPVSIGDSYSDGLSVSGGKSPYFWEVISGALPDGLSLNSSTGAITGTVTTGGTFDFTLQVTDALGGIALSVDEIVVTAPAAAFDPTFTSPNLILSNSDRSIHHDVTGGWDTALTVTGHSAGKYRLAFEFNTSTGAGYEFGGIASTSTSLTTFVGGGGSVCFGWQFGTTSYHSSEFTFVALFDNIFPVEDPAFSGNRQSVMMLDITNGKGWLSDHLNTGWMGGGDPELGTSPTFTFTSIGTVRGAMSAYVSSGSSVHTIFTGTSVPSAVSALCAACPSFNPWG